MGREFRIYLGGGAEVFAGMGTRLGTLKFRAFAHSLSLSVPLSLSLSLFLSVSFSLSLSRCLGTITASSTCFGTMGLIRAFELWGKLKPKIEATLIRKRKT